MDDLTPLIKMKVPVLWGSFEVFISKIVDGLFMEKVTEKNIFKCGSNSETYLFPALLFSHPHPHTGILGVSVQPYRQHDPKLPDLLDVFFRSKHNIRRTLLCHLLVTSAPLGAWKCNFPPLKEIITDRNTNQITDGHKVTLPSQASILILKAKRTLYAHASKLEDRSY